MAQGVASAPIDPKADNLSNPLIVDRGVDITPKWFCYLFNVSKFTQKIERGPRNFNLQGVRGGERYCIGAVIPSTVVDSWIDTEGNRRFMYNDGEDVTRDAITPGETIADNQDLSKWGIGYFKRGVEDKKPTPTEEELAEVEQKYDDNMRVWLEDADRLAAGGQLALINPIHLRAAQHFKAERSWNRQVEHPVTCPSCGENVKPGVKRHFKPNGCGYLFVSKEEAFAAGILSPEEIAAFGFAKAPEAEATEGKKAAGRKS